MVYIGLAYVVYQAMNVVVSTAKDPLRVGAIELTKLIHGFEKKSEG